MITVSPWSKNRIVRDLGVAAHRIHVVSNPSDPAFGARIMEMRRARERQETVLYVGSFAPHKNVARLVEAFGRTMMYRDGGRLLLVGGDPSDAGHLGVGGADRRIEIVGRCPQTQLDGYYAEARILVQPSLEEGFGLPVWEAMSAGIPVACSVGGALTTVRTDAAAIFDPFSTVEMAAAIDAAATAARAQSAHDEATAAHHFLSRAPSPRDYADAMENAVLRLTRLMP